MRGYHFWPRRLKIALALLLLLVVMLPFAPHKMLKEGAPVEYGRCEYFSDEYPLGEYLDLTAEQAACVLDVLQGLWCYRVWGEDKFFLADQVLQITLYIDEQPFYVTLGRRDWCGDARWPFRQFDIIGGDKATEQILLLLGIDEKRINGRREL